MMPQLTESWAGVYLQVAATILVFVLGIPLIVEQINISEDLRWIIHRHRRQIEWLIPSLFSLATLATLYFIWVFHPIAANIFKQRQNELTFISNFGNLVASLLMTLVVLTPAMILRALQISYRRDGILSYLKQKCEQHIRSEGIPDERALEDIRYLGEQGKTRGEKVQVLQILWLLAKEAQAQKQYKGNGLEDIIKAIEFTLQKGADIDSFTEGILILRRIIENMPESNLDSSSDVGIVLRTLRRLGNIAQMMLDERPVRMVLKAVEFIGQKLNTTFSEVAMTLLEMGIVALEDKRFLIALEALGSLEAITWPKQPLDSHTSVAYLGLIAHFWAQKGSARRHALASLKGVMFIPSRQKCLKEAREILFELAHFETADKLVNMASTR